MAYNTFDINLVVFNNYICFLYWFQIYVCHVSSAVSKFVFVYHISSTLDGSRGSDKEVYIIYVDVRYFGFS